MFSEISGIIYIEEPEMHLHPGLQRRLIELYAGARHLVDSTTFNQYIDRFQFFITTHSNHIVDTASEYGATIFSFRKFKTDKNETRIQVINHEKHSIDILNELGVRNSSVLLANCTVWIEGVTDLRYIKHFMKLYLEKLSKEDINKYELYQSLLEGRDYAFIEYSGSNLAHWKFSDEKGESEDFVSELRALSISNRIMVIADRDDSKSNGELVKQTKHDKLKGVIGDNYYVNVNCNEIENFLSWQVILDVIKAPKNQKRKYEALKNKYQDIKLGNLFSSVNKTNKLKYLHSNIATIANKDAFTKTALGLMNDYTTLTKDAIELCEKIYSFICKSNNKILKKEE